MNRGIQSDAPVISRRRYRRGWYLYVTKFAAMTLE
jgi:hypothetical protein